MSHIYPKSLREVTLLKDVYLGTQSLVEIMSNYVEEVGIDPRENKNYTFMVACCQSTRSYKGREL